MAFSDYFYHLLHRIFKRRPRDGSDADKLTRALGPNYDEALEVILKLREQSFVTMADGEALDQVGKDRGLPRYRGESEEEYRKRLLAAYSIHSQMGTASAMSKAFEIIGFNGAEIQELRQEDPARWAEFRVLLELPQAVFTEPQRANMVNTVRQMKPAHTKLASLDLVAPAADATGAGEDILTWGEQVTWNQFACPLPAETLLPSDDLYPC